MDLTNEQLIAEAVEITHAGIGKAATLERYRDHLVHYGHFQASAQGANFYTARSKHVRLFMGHLEKPGGAYPHASRLRCETTASPACGLRAENCRAGDGAIASCEGGADARGTGVRAVGPSARRIHATSHSDLGQRALGRMPLPRIQHKRD